MISLKHIWVITVILIIAVAYVFARIVNDKLSKGIYNPTAITKASNVNKFKSFAYAKTKEHDRTYYDIILKNNIFVPDRNVSRSRRSRDKNISLSNKPQTTDLKVELLGTYLRNNGGKSIAIIKNTNNNKIDGYTTGNMVSIIKAEKVKLLKIENCKVTINRRTRGNEVISCNSTNRVTKKIKNSRTSTNKTGIEKVEQNRWLIEKKMLDELLEDPSKLLTQARAVPKKDGLRFISVQPSSVFFKIGLRNGDILHTINEVELNDMKNVWSIFEQLKGETEFIINFTRKGNKHSYSYNIN